MHLTTTAYRTKEIASVIRRWHSYLIISCNCSPTSKRTLQLCLHLIFQHLHASAVNPKARPLLLWNVPSSISCCHFRGHRVMQRHCFSPFLQPIHIFRVIPICFSFRTTNSYIPSDSQITTISQLNFGCHLNESSRLTNDIACYDIG